MTHRRRVMAVMAITSSKGRARSADAGPARDAGKFLPTRPGTSDAAAVFVPPGKPPVPGGGALARELKPTSA
jgi:hypothetical protein